MNEQLNEQQQRAVTAGDGPIVIIAGPGTGKTKTLTARIAHMLTQGVPAHDIIALTFTNKAAREMQERLAARMPLGQDLPIIATFHALAERLLPKAETTLITEAERNALLQSIKQQAKIPGNVRDLGLIISTAKNQLQPDSGTTSLLEAYQQELTAAGKHDFDDLLLRLHEVLQDGDSHSNYTARYVLVDEFQDTNELQYAIARRLCAADNLFVIGDPLQSIYGFRGASAAIFDTFKADFPAATEIRLDTNYRSRPEIIKATCAIFPHMPALMAHRTQPGKVCSVEVLNEYGEADWVINEIERHIGGSTMLRSSAHHNTAQRLTFRDFAILSRTHAVARTMQKALEASGLPFQVAGEGSPYEHPDIQAILQACTYLVTLQPAAIYGCTPSQASVLLAPFVHQTLPLPKLAETIAGAFGIAIDTPDMRQFFNSLVRYKDVPLANYLTHISAMQEQAYYDTDADAITLGTIHASKGLEFACVFLLGCEQGVLPHTRQGMVTAINEERRLFYVAASRARDELYLLHTQKRSAHTTTISPFVRDLPKEVVTAIVDPTIAAQKLAIKRRQLKRAQGSLF